MQIKVREGDVFPLNRSQQVWWGDNPEVMQVARFAGKRTPNSPCATQAGAH